MHSALTRLGLSLKAKSLSHKLRLEAATAVDTPVKAMNALIRSKHTSEEVLLAVILRDDASDRGYTTSIMYKSTSPTLQRLIAARETNCGEAGDINYLVSSKDASVREALACNQNVQAFDLSFLVHDEVAEVAIAALEHPNTAMQDIYDVLTYSPQERYDPAVRAAALTVWEERAAERSAFLSTHYPLLANVEPSEYSEWAA